MTEFIADMTLAEGLGQVCGLVALGFCIAGFANKNDDRLMVLLISANVAFALMFAFFESWTASALTVLVILRITLARKYQGNWPIMLGMLAVNLVVAWATWKSITDVFPLAAAVAPWPRVWCWSPTSSPSSGSIGCRRNTPISRPGVERRCGSAVSHLETD